MYRVLLVEDSPESRRLVEATLSPEIRVDSVGSAAEAEDRLRQASFDLVILDVVLPDQDGFKLCSSLQNSPKTKDVPIMFLSGKTAIDDRVLGFSVGAEDYMVKPFAPAELRARVQAKLKRVSQKKQDKMTYRKNDLTFDVSFHRVSFRMDGADRPLDVTPIEFRLLLHLAQNEEQVFSRDQLMTLIWGENVHRVDRVIDVHLSKIRKKLQGTGYTIQCVPKVGYAFMRAEKVA